MANIERNSSQNPENTGDHKQLDLDVPSLETALQSSPEEHLDWHLGPGVIFRLGTDRSTSLELYSQTIRVSLPHAQVAVLRREAETAPEGVIFQDPRRFFLSVGPEGDVLFQYSATNESQAETSDAMPPPLVPVTKPEGQRAAVQESKEKPKSEKYLGRLGEVKSHRTKQGKLVAEVEMSVPDPDTPGSSKLVKFVAFDEKAEALGKNYSPGQQVTAVGIPHELKRRNKEGREWVERQLYLVQLPKVRGS